MKPLTAFALAALLLAVPARAEKPERAVPVEVVNSSQGPVPVVLAGTPTVKIAALPALTIANGAGAPVPVREIDNAARSAFQAYVTMDVATSFRVPVAIPEGKRLVIESIVLSGSVIAPSGPSRALITFNAGLGGSGTSCTFGVPPVPNLPEQVEAVIPVKLYADQLSLGIGYTGANPFMMTIGVWISGYLVTL